MELKKSVLATIAYYDRLDWPLTLFEAHRFLINPQRLTQAIEGLGEVSLHDVTARLDQLVEAGSVGEQWGMYFLAGREKLCQERIEREKISTQKWKLFIRCARWLQVAPWVRGLFASGSLALGNMDQSSDFDILVVTKPGRLYLARLALSIIAATMGMLRRKHEIEAPDKFCFNHYITADRLCIGHQSLYNAQTYTHLVPVWPDLKLTGEFFVANIWMNKFLYNFRPHQEMVLKTVTDNQLLRSMALTIERLLVNPAGDALERLARRWQQQRIETNPLTHAAGGRVVYTDHELEFHPRSFERTVLDAYNTAIQRLAISTRLEPDSGLNR